MRSRLRLWDVNALQRVARPGKVEIEITGPSKNLLVILDWTAELQVEVNAGFKRIFQETELLKGDIGVEVAATVREPEPEGTVGQTVGEKDKAGLTVWTECHETAWNGGDRAARGKKGQGGEAGH